MKMMNKDSVLQDQPHEGFHLLGTFAVILLCLAFIGAGFYLFIANYA